MVSTRPPDLTRAALACPTTFADDFHRRRPRSGSALSSRFLHDMSSSIPGKKLSVAASSFFTDNVAFASRFDEARPSFTSTAVRSQRSETFGTVRLAFATTCHFTKSLIRTYRRLCRPASRRGVSSPSGGPGYNGNWCFRWRDLHPLEP